MTIWRMQYLCWVPKGRDTHSQYVIFIAFPLQQWLHEQVLILRYTSSLSFNLILLCCRHGYGLDGPRIESR